MTDWTKEEDEAFNEVEKNSNLGKQILQAQGQPYHWTGEATKAAVKIEREECARIADEWAVGYPHPSTVIAEAIRARGYANDTSSERVDINGKRKHDN